MKKDLRNARHGKISDFPDRKLQSSFRVDLSHYSTDTMDIPAKGGDRPAMMAIKDKRERAERFGRSKRSPAYLHDFPLQYP